jgi:hypothetical protein
MKTFIKFLVPLVILSFLILAMPGQALAAQSLKVILGGTFTLASGETLNEDLTIIGGAVVLEKGSIVYGKVIVLGGSLEINGTINGDIVAAGGHVKLGESAVVNGDITSAGGFVDKDLGAEISGELQSELSGALPLALPGIRQIPALNLSFSWVWRGLWFLAQIFILSALAVLVAMFLPKHLERMNRTVVTQPLLAGSMGLLTAFISPFVILLLVITICLIPAALVGILLLALLMLFGWVACGLEVGKRLGVALNQEWTAPISAGVGTFLLTFVIGGMGKIWCIGWIFPTVVAMIGLGAAILTRVGTRDYPETIVRGLQAPFTPLVESQPEANETLPSESEGEEPAEGI